MKKNNCKDCEGLGYYTEVISTGLSDPNDPYHYPHTERCDTCKVFDDDEQADKFVKSIERKKVTIIWGTDKENKKTYRFETEEQLKYFMMGVDEGNGWLEYEVEK